ncbi:flagellin N-terminal helical domain-containing protein [Tepidiphilus olei]|uniref:flagellin N-terminal helical domain-containing protein n=1 Tax=Tepidiphilus olei TaxID=2502184 RepID=UPI00163D9C0A|nr:flagellin [Tepidiphilus olei]
MAVINTNIASLNAQRNLLKSQNDMQTAMQRLSSGLRINSAKDDAAGLAISDRMTAQINGLNQATRNANDAMSIAQVAEGAMGEITNALQRIRVLAVQSANDTNTATDRVSLQKEVKQLQDEITRLATQTSFNGKALLDGSFQNQIFQVGAYANQSISFGIDSVKAADMGAQSVAGRANIGELNATASLDDTTTNGVAAGTLKISSAQTPAGGVAISISEGQSAKDIAAAVNAVAGQTGVNATASTTATLNFAGYLNNGVLTDDPSASPPTLATTVTFTLQGQEITVSDATNGVTLTALADAINNANTGVTATLDDPTNPTKIILTAADGSDIKIGDFTASAGGSTVSASFKVGTEASAPTITSGGANDSIVIGGQVSFVSANTFSVTDDGTKVLSSSLTTKNSGFTSGSEYSVDKIDITTQAGANRAISIVDAALAYVDDQRANLGAIQNRFSSVVSSNSVTSENVAAARSRVLDADFAAETANLSRAQILQQAGTAMLAQANASTQNVLTLLR